MNKLINRRNFLRNSIYASAGAGIGLGLGLPGMAMATNHCPVLPYSWSMPRTLVNVMLYGGMDSKFIFVPAPDHDTTYSSDYQAKLWAARENLYGGGYSSYADMFTAEYGLPVTDPLTGLKFGIHNSCGWLKTQYSAGNVAIVANSFCSKNRRHDQSQLNANVGEPAYSTLLYDRHGWGGRFVEQLGTANTVELSHEISVFGNGTTVGQRLDKVIHAQDMRDIALPNTDNWSNVTDDRRVMTRALKAYYEARALEVTAEKPESWPYHLFYQHNSAFREFGDQVECRLNDFALPGSLSGLDLNQNHFERQCRNLYDVCLAPDILNSRAVSMRYDGWDTHNNQIGRITNNLSDLFGSAGGLSTAMTEISSIPTDGANADDQLLFCFTTDFGRQLRANGDNGTDHGRGLYTIMIGKDVNLNKNQRVYGEMFPERESNPDPDNNNRIPFETSGADVEGRTSTERILAKACDWVQPGSSANTFPNLADADIEAIGLLDNLLA